jgi:YbbR domain-containing protein
MPRISMIRKFFNNSGYKLTALVLAVLVWYVVQGEEVLEVNARLDVKVELGPGLALRDAAPITRDMTLRGPRVLVGGMTGKTFTAVIRVSAGKTGNLRFRLDKEFIPRWDNRIRLTIHDPYVTFLVEERLTRMIPVKPTILGTPEPPLMLDEASTAPGDIEVSGARSDVARILELTTEPIDVSHLGESKVVSTSIAKANLPDVSLGQTNVRVTLRVGPKKSLKTFAVVPIEITDSEKVSSARPASISLTVKASDEQLTKLSLRDIRASVSVKDLGPGRYQLPVITTVPESSSVHEITPKNVTVEIYNQRKLQ